MTSEPVDTLVEDDRWMDAGLASIANRATIEALNWLALDPSHFEISLLGCDDRRIAELNAAYRGKDQATNVLSWPAEDRSPDNAGTVPTPPAPNPDGMPLELGDIAISFDTCQREAADAGKDFEAHVTHLIVHGVLHLLGYDHIDDKDAAIMEGAEINILGKLGIATPY